MAQGFKEHFQNISSALVVAFVIFMAGNWYSTGRAVDTLIIKVNHLEEFANTGERFTAAQGRQMSSEIHRLEEQMTSCRERISSLESYIKWNGRD